MDTKKIGSLWFTVLFLICFFVVHGFAWEQEFELERIVVTATKGQERDVQFIPANITVITSEDIAKSNARTIPDLLKSEVGLVVRDILGNGGQVSVDIRGFGEAAAMNCTILIDGRRINNIDMANPDLTQISLAQVERIEVLRGGAGVLYGNNAVGGVINIITKKPEKKRLNASISFNAFNGTDFRFGVEDVIEKFSYSISGSHRFSGGYRLHSEMNASDVGVRIGAEEKDSVVGWDLNVGFHRDNYQFPGSVNQTDWDSGYYWKTYTPYDKGESTDWYSRLVVKKSIRDLKTETEISLRNRDAKSFFDSWGLFDRRYTRVLGAGEKISYNLFGVDLLGGVEYYSNSYNISPDTRTGDPTAVNDDQRLNRYSTAGYFQVITPTLFDRVFLELGGRIEGVNQHFVVEKTSSDTFIPEVLDALSAGLSLKILEGTNAYARWAKSFRLPTTDEYYTGMKYLSLKPQKSQDVELGVKYTGKKIGANFSLFLMRTQDELYFDNGAYENKNYPDPTVRMGGELQVKARLAKFASVSLGYTLTDARFDTGGTGVYAGKEIPLVPRHKGDIKLLLNLPLDINLGANCTLVSDRWFGNEYQQTSEKRRLHGYTVVDLKVSRQFENIRLFGAIDNIGDIKYAESGFTWDEYDYTTWPFTFLGHRYGYYPSPVRNFSVGMEVNM
ncbi:hypothetical protein AUJ66_04070 [Candidatus Desantisbacteria bacterium CG1_02_38_46]|uniref:TonB-dependent receptor plug domain-containing protein n=1 Tax=Candidatus Desantisbacteria bacterium CG1_02_38_46 TaxID=1817893 RepID=A0A1J4SEY0_9BACT|nr:MAG: hypothetical protein AUJ66_04070 [Candidatus Desantisbacteria bacterium CG1_02_38_46]